MAEDPILIRGGSINIEFNESTFDDITGGGKKKFKHKNDPTLTRIVITRGGSPPDSPITLGKTDKIEIYYDVPDNP